MGEKELWLRMLGRMNARGSQWHRLKDLGIDKKHFLFLVLNAGFHYVALASLPFTVTPGSLQICNGLLLHHVPSADHIFIMPNCSF